MSAAAKVMAAVESVVAFGHHEQSPLEFAALDSANVRDPIKLFNVYGYGTDASSASLILLWRHLGFPARAWTVNRWGMVPEVFYDQAWHAYDPIMVCWFRKPDSSIASVEELAQGVRNWYETHPELKGDQPKLRTFLKENGVAQGPEILRDCPTYDQQGNFRFSYFGWYTAMLLYDGSNKTPFLYEESATLGYRVNNQLHRGETLTLRWSNSGKHANQDGAGGMSEMLTAAVGKGVLHFTPACGDLANGRIGNGTLDWSPPLDPDLIANALVAQNIIAASGALRPQDGSNPATLVLRRASSYLFLGGQVAFDATIAAKGGITVELSDDLGHSWSQLSRITVPGPASIDLAATLRRYEYRLRLVLDGKGTSLSTLHIINDIQHSQRALPALAEGINHINGSTGPDEGVIAVEGAGPMLPKKAFPGNA